MREASFFLKPASFFLNSSYKTDIVCSGYLFSHRFSCTQTKKNALEKRSRYLVKKRERSFRGERFFVYAKGVSPTNHAGETPLPARVDLPTTPQVLFLQYLGSSREINSGR